MLEHGFFHVNAMQQYYEDGARIEAAFRKYFHRAEPEQEKDTFEVIVCHANVIRYFTCRYDFLAFTSCIVNRYVQEDLFENAKWGLILLI